MSEKTRSPLLVARGQVAQLAFGLASLDQFLEHVPDFASQIPAAYDHLISEMTRFRGELIQCLEENALTPPIPGSRDSQTSATPT